MEVAKRLSSSYSSGGETKSKLEDETAPLKGGKAALMAMEEPYGRDTWTYDWDRSFKFWACGCFSFIMQLVLVAALASLVFGWNISVTNTLISHLSWEWHWCDFEEVGQEITGCTKDTNFQAFISTAQFIGATIGAFLSGAFLFLGRRNMLMMSLVIFGFGTISAICANSFTFLFWARLCGGFGIGISSVAVPAYMSEMCPPSKRGKYTILHQTLINIGIFLSTVVGLPLGLATPVPTEPGPQEEIDGFAQVWWRVIFGLGLLPIILDFYLLMKVFSFETPHHYIERGHMADAEQLVKLILQKDDVTVELKEITDEIESAKRAQESGISLGSALRKADYRFVIIFGCCLSALQQLSGINVHMATSTSLFKEAGLEEEIAIVITVVMTIINTCATLVAVPFIERKGRKTLMVFGTVVETVALLPAALCYWIDEDAEYTRWLAIVGCLVFVAAFGATYGPVLWVYLFEIYPLEIRGAAAGAATAANWLAGVILVFLGSYVRNQILFTIFCAFALIGAVNVIVLMKETKGRVLGDSPYMTRRVQS